MLRFRAQIAKISNSRKYPLYGKSLFKKKYEFYKTNKLLSYTRARELLLKAFSMDVSKEQPRLWHILTQFQSPFVENVGVVLYKKGYQMIELFILLQLIQFWHQIRIQ